MKRIVGITFVLLLIASGSAFTFSNYSKEKVEKEKVEVIEIHADFVADFTDKRNLVGASDYVFIGKVISQNGQVNLHLPTTQYSVEIIKEIKGSFDKDEIVIRQYGGYTEDEDGNKVLKLFENDKLIESGKTYMFTANKQEDGSILIIPTYGNNAIKDKLAESTLEKEYTEAFKNQRIPDLIQRIKNKNTNTNTN